MREQYPEGSQFPKKKKTKQVGFFFWALILKAISFCTLAGEYKYTMWQSWQLPSQRERFCLLVRGAGFHNSIINFYQTCTEHLWHIKQPLCEKKLQLSACIGAASDLQAGWNNLCKKPLVTKGEKYKQIYLVEGIYYRRIAFFFCPLSEKFNFL